MSGGRTNRAWGEWQQQKNRAFPRGERPGLIEIQTLSSSFVPQGRLPNEGFASGKDRRGQRSRSNWSSRSLDCRGSLSRSRFHDDRVAGTVAIGAAAGNYLTATAAGAAAVADSSRLAAAGAAAGSRLAAAGAAAGSRLTAAGATAVASRSSFAATGVASCSHFAAALLGLPLAEQTVGLLTTAALGSVELGQQTATAGLPTVAAVAGHSTGVAANQGNGDQREEHRNRTSEKTLHHVPPK